MLFSCSLSILLLHYYLHCSIFPLSSVRNVAMFIQYLRSFNYVPANLCNGIGTCVRCTWQCSFSTCSIMIFGALLRLQQHTFCINVTNSGHYYMQYRINIIMLPCAQEYILVHQLIKCWPDSFDFVNAFLSKALIKMTS